MAGIAKTAAANCGPGVSTDGAVGSGTAGTLLDASTTIGFEAGIDIPAAGDDGSGEAALEVGTMGTGADGTLLWASIAIGFAEESMSAGTNDPEGT